jgi:hypothetical protein
MKGLKSNSKCRYLLFNSVKFNNLRSLIGKRMSDLNKTRIENNNSFFTLIIVGYIHELSETRHTSVLNSQPARSVSGLYKFDASISISLTSLI